MFQNLTAQQAAAQIVGLINASPRSPRQDEIEAIIARIGVPPDPLGQVSPTLATAFAEWDTVRQHYEAAGSKYGHTDDADDKVQADYWSGVFGEKSEELLALGPVVCRTAIAVAGRDALECSDARGFTQLSGVHPEEGL